MRHPLRARHLAGALALAAGLLAAAPAPAQPPAAGTRDTKLLPAFPDFGHMPKPEEYQGRTFKLSQNYPATRPPLDPGIAKILKIDFRTDWEAYLKAVRDYVYEGNIEDRGPAEAFFLEDNKKRDWYHVPWQHWGPQGRDGIHGLTKEGPVLPKVLGPAQNNEWQTYAVGFYNRQGGWAIGQVWADPQNPRLTPMKNGGFPVGTVVGKVLFTTTPVAEAPFLTAPIQWLAYTTRCFMAPASDPKSDCATRREVSTVRFIQMDIMVRDPRADATGGWVFGTFVYNGALANTNPWHNAVPVGIMWGNDPTVTSQSDSNPAPTATRINPDLKQTIINPSKDLPPMHLGWGLRLNGPVDNSLSSCQSCHSTAQYPAISPILPFLAKKDGKALQPGTPEWMRFFRNVRADTPFDRQAVSMDYSLQLAASIQNFIESKARDTDGLYHLQYWNGLPVHGIRGQRGAVPAK